MLRDKIFLSNHERTFFTRCSGAHSYFEATDDISNPSKAVVH